MIRSIRRAMSAPGRVKAQVTDVHQPGSYCAGCPIRLIGGRSQPAEMQPGQRMNECSVPRGQHMCGEHLVVTARPAALCHDGCLRRERRTGNVCGVQIPLSAGVP